MAALGWEITRMSAGDFKIWTHPGGGRRVGIDVFSSFYVDDTFYMVPTVTGTLDRSALLPVGEVTLEGRRFVAPARPEELLEVTYGPSWRVPDPSFAYDPSRATRRRFNGWLRNNRKHLRYWGISTGRASDRVPTTPAGSRPGWRTSSSRTSASSTSAAGTVATPSTSPSRDTRSTPSTAPRAALQLTRQLAQEALGGGRTPAPSTSTTWPRRSCPAPATRTRSSRPTSTPASCSTPSSPTPGRTSSAGPQMIQRRGGLTFLEFRTGAAPARQGASLLTTARSSTPAGSSPRSSSTAAPWCTARRASAWHRSRARTHTPVDS